jgi:transposase
MEMFMARQKRSYSQEYRDEAVKMVIETSRPIAVVARELGLLDGTLGNWVSAYRKSYPVEEQPLALPDRARLKELERENRELRLQNEFLKKAAAFFAQDHR